MIDPVKPIPANLRAAMSRQPVFAPWQRQDAASVAVAPAAAQSASVEYAEPTDAFVGLEKVLHREFAADMGRREVHLLHARTDKVSTIEAGAPDFHCLFTAPDGVTRGCVIEFKVAGKKPSDRQRECIKELRRKNIPVLVAWTLRDAINFARENLLC